MRHIIYTILVLFIISFYSCRVSKTTTKNDAQRRIHPISLRKLQNNINKSYLSYDYLQFKLSAKIKMGKTRYSLRGQIRMKKDSIIWLNLNHATGIPVMKMQLLDDSIVFRNSLNSEYYAGGYNFLENWFKLELNFYYFQSMLTNELFTYPDYQDVFDLKKGNYKDGIDSNLYCLKSLKDRRIKRHLRKNQLTGLIVQNIFINPETFKISKITIEEFDQNRTLNISYSNYVTISDKLIPKEIHFVINTDTSSVDFKLRYTKITNDKKLEFPFQIPDKYTKIQ